MEVTEVVIPYARPDEIHLYPLGDLHAGTIHCAEHHVKQKVKEIQSDPFAYWIGMGDYGDFITPSDPRWSSGEVAKWIQPDNIVEGQRRWLRDTLSPIKDKCIGLLFGNHEEKLRKHKQDNVHQNLCDDLGVKNLSYSAFVHFIFRRKSSKEAHLVKGAFTHGASGAITEGGAVNALIRWMAQAFDSQIFGYGHVHRMQLATPDGLGTNDALKITAKTKIGVLTGSYYRTYTQGENSSYGEQKCYPPTRIGSPMFRINPDKGIISVDTPVVMWA